MCSEWFRGLLSGEKDIEEKGIAKVEWAVRDMIANGYDALVSSEWLQGYTDAIKHYHKIN